MIEIYGKSGCRWCEEAKKLATNYNLPFKYISIDDQENKQQMLERVPNAKTVPQIFWHKRYIGGYNDFATEIENTIGNYGNEKI